MNDKKCNTCKLVLSVTEFYAHPKAPDGLQSKCKECLKECVKGARRARPEHYSDYERKRFQTAERKAQAAEAGKRHRAKHPDRYKARVAVNNAIRDGRLIKGPCEACGTTKRVQAHHEDYSKPLEVRWLCFHCHREEGHGQTVVTENEDYR